VLPANPQRWFVRFTLITNVPGGAMVQPAPGIGSGAITSIAGFPLEVKFRDRPAACTGAWVFTGPAGATVIAEEDLYVRG
jgi:hypothetical protein